MEGKITFTACCMFFDASIAPSLGALLSADLSSVVVFSMGTSSAWILSVTSALAALLTEPSSRGLLIGLSVSFVFT